MIEKGEPTKTSEYEIGTGINLSSMLVKGGGYPIKLPFIDVSEIGAGGGSIVSTDEGGPDQGRAEERRCRAGTHLLRSGRPRSTLTDALVVLGYFNPDFLVGGSLRLNAAKARAAIKEHVARPMDNRSSMRHTVYSPSQWPI